ncbi:type II toxin-antitoxin system RelE/ParE family toxin [Spirosoma lacussanchae]|uniref:type II toxin-antitoxin system RelE/ParE family toxin n=1 Tax=Spirosoma lacussanchae TaxID=1884249 RepID=UPI001107AADD|nr:type II toxin-antitoxin system RelE/ParE family toxin [Spirosoma lacussanchae]
MFHEPAIDDLDAINEYRSAYSPAYADHLIDTIIAKIDRLRTFPQLGRKVPEFDLPTLRELIHNDYRIVYKLVDDEKIDIITIQHSSRNLQERFFDAT